MTEDELLGEGLIPATANAGAPCMLCRRASPYVEISFEGPVCSPLHARAMWQLFLLESFGRGADHHGFWP